MFDYNDGGFIHTNSGNMGMNDNGDLFMRSGDNMATNLSTGELHITSGWDNNNNFNSFNNSNNFGMFDDD